jgi:nitroreductase
MEIAKKITEILEEAVFAPSGDNSQPWHFVVRENVIDVYSLPEKDNVLFNYRQRGTLVAHGALLTNISLIAETLGYSINVNFWPDPEDSSHTFRVELKPTTPATNPLVNSIRSRQTNRKFYADIPLKDEHKNSLLHEGNTSPDVKFILIEDPKQKQLLGEAVSKNEVVMLENRQLHDLFYADIRWTTSSERSLKTGLYLKTMELPLQKLIFFKILQFWPIARILNQTLKLSRFIAKDNSKLYSNGSALGLLIVPNDDQMFFEAGKISQRIWLNAEQLGISMHPVTGIVYLAQRIKAGEYQTLSEEHAKIIRDAYGIIQDVAKLDDQQCVAMLFRIGYSTPPSGVSSRLKPEIKYS